MKSFTLFFFLVFLGRPAFSEFKEIKSMKEILSKVTPGTLLIFDLDNTLLEPAQTLGSDQWFRSLLAQREKAGANPEAAVDESIPKWEAVQKVTKVSATEASTPSLIRRFQDQGIKVMALTARPVALSQATEKQLKTVGVDFTRSLVSREKEKNYVNGVYFMGAHQEKGPVLVAFLKQIKYEPNNIVFVDDTASNVVSVEKSLETCTCSHTGFRYGFDDQKVSRFDIGIADEEWGYFNEHKALISDSEARRLLGLKH